MQSLRCFLIIPRLCISVGSYTPIFPDGKLYSSYADQPNMGKLNKNSQ